MTSVLHVVSDTDRRGAQTFAVQLCEELVRHDIAGEVVALQRGTQDGHDLRVLGEPAAWRTRRTLLDLRREASKHDVAIGHGSTSLPALAANRLTGGARFIYRSIGDPSFWGAGTARRMRSGALLATADRVVALWEGARQATHELYRVPLAQIDVIPNAVTDHFREPTSAERLLARSSFGLDDREWLAWVGNLSDEKDPLLAVEVAAEAGAGLVVAGDGPLRARMAVEATKRGVDLRMLGAVADVRAVYWAADVLVLTSRTEGQPAVLAEARYSGCPVAAVDAGDVAPMLNALGGAPVADRKAPALVHAVRRCARSNPTRPSDAFRMAAVARSWSRLVKDLQ